MKKFIYIILIGLASSLAITSCTEEQVNPNVENDMQSAPGGGGSTGNP